MPIDDNAQRVTVREVDWAAGVRKRWGKDWSKPDPGYEFTGRKFDDNPDGGPYTDQD